MNKFDKIIADKLNQASDYPADVTVWKSIENNLHGSTSLNNQFKSSLYAGIAASLLFGALFSINSPSNKPSDKIKDGMSESSQFTEEQSNISQSNHSIDLHKEFKLQEEHKIAFSSSKKQVSSGKVTHDNIEQQMTPSSDEEVEKKLDLIGNNASENKTAKPTDSSENNTSVAFDFTASGIQCIDEVIYFETNSPADNIEWIFDGSHLKQGASVNQLFTTEGVHEVVMLVEQNDQQYSVRKEIEIYSKPQPIIDIEIRENNGCFKQEVAFKASPEHNSYDWYIAQTKVSSANGFVSLESGSYNLSLTAVNEYGCFAKHSQLVTVEGGLELYIPSSFTPNNDGQNDVWFPKGLENTSHFEIKVFRIQDRSLVFETSDLNPWDGTLSKTAEQAQRGDKFIYEIIIEDNCSDTKKLSDMITVL
ncbi:MAG: T9SS type B sorting domain-containing protein [Salibacteraceae bacterium]